MYTEFLRLLGALLGQAVRNHECPTLKECSHVRDYTITLTQEELYELQRLLDVARRSLEERDRNYFLTHSFTSHVIRIVVSAKRAEA